MENKMINDSQDSRIQNLLGGFLPARSSINGSESYAGAHLDDDSLTAFVEGNLNRRESQPIIKHLVDCSFCRHITAELVKLDYAFAGIEENQPVNVIKENEPSKISDVLNGLLSRIFGTTDSAVFAHNEAEDEAENSEKPAKPEEDK